MVLEISRGMAFDCRSVVLTLLGCLIGRSIIKRQFINMRRPLEIAFFFTAFAFFLVQSSWGASVVFNTEGATSWTVPAGVSSITVKAWGGGGGGGGGGASTAGAAGGGAGFAQATLNVTPGESLSIYVGDAGDRGRNSNSYTGGGGQGGGYSGVKRGSTQLIIAAGGGGGGGGDNASGTAAGAGGAGGGTSGGAGGPSDTAIGGGGGTPSAGGAAGGGTATGGSSLTGGIGGSDGNGGGAGGSGGTNAGGNGGQGTANRPGGGGGGAGKFGGGAVNKLTRERLQAQVGEADRPTQLALQQALLPGVAKMQAMTAIRITQTMQGKEAVQQARLAPGLESRGAW